jgi:hypothetical protein
MSVAWSLFKTAVLKAVADDRKEQRQLRALERIAQALDDLADQGHANRIDSQRDGHPYGYYTTPPPKG